MGNLFCRTTSNKEPRRVKHGDVGSPSPIPSSPVLSPTDASSILFSSPKPNVASGGDVAVVCNYPAIHEGNCAAIAVLGDGSNHVLSGGEDRCLHLTDWTNNQSVFRIAAAHGKDINRIVYCRRRQQAVTASRDKEVKVFSISDSGNVVHTCSGHTFNVSALTVNPEETHIFSGARDNHVRLWDIETGQCVTFNRTARNLVQNAKWISSSSLVAQSSEDLYLRFWDTRDRLLKCAFSFSALEYHAPGLDCSEDGQYVLTGHNGFAGEGSWAKLWDVRMQQHVRTFAGHQYTISNAAFLGGNRRGGCSLAITTSNDGTVRLWDVNNGECLQVNYFNEGRITSMSVVPKVATKCNSQEADVLLGFLSGMLAAYSLTDTLELQPLVQYGDPGGAISPDAE
eukprot:GGOE01053538.1.p1 GENE.GGOE01053538.1~~GGOE01053538.1.p1  ORF type:complete len:397 (+),score=93.50 GGOE01053538.1:94-1284(+)